MDSWGSCKMSRRGVKTVMKQSSYHAENQLRGHDKWIVSWVCVIFYVGNVWYDVSLLVVMTEAPAN